jgi:hypothetical protein
MYSDSQPRDERGRFASGNSGARLTQAAAERVALNRAVDAGHFPPHGEDARADLQRGARYLSGHGMVDSRTVVGQHAGAKSVGTDGVLNLTESMHANSPAADVNNIMSQQYGGMSARQHGLAAKQHWNAADKSSGSDRAAHFAMGNWHAAQRESLTGRGMKV